MNDERKENTIERYTRWVAGHHVWVILASVMVAVLVGTGVTQLGLSSDYRVFFSKDNPDLQAFNAMENTYAKNDNVLFVLRPRDGDVFTPRILEAIRSLTNDAWQKRGQETHVRGHSERAQTEHRESHGHDYRGPEDGASHTAKCVSYRLLRVHSLARPVVLCSKGNAGWVAT
jgi:predicted RND superfamily exporter protein